MYFRDVLGHDFVKWVSGSGKKRITVYLIFYSYCVSGDLRLMFESIINWRKPRMSESYNFVAWADTINISKNSPTFQRSED